MKFFSPFKYSLFTCIGFLLLSALPASAQVKDSTASFKISGYADAYYAYYSDSVGTNKYQKFPVISPKSNVFGLNIFQLTAQYTSEKIRAVGTLHYGDIPVSAWSPVYNFIQEANVGFHVCKKIWIDAGFFKTHIGTEALLPKDNIASSLAIITVYEPWFQAGVKLSYAPNDKLSLCLHLLNGYNTFVDNNGKKSIGLSVIYQLGSKGSLGYYNLLGDETPAGTPGNHMRFLNNLVFSYDLTPKLKALIGVDYIGQLNSGLADTTSLASVYSAIVTFRYQLKPKLGVYIRGEAFSDQDGILTGVMTDAKNIRTGYVLTGETLGFEYKMTSNSYIRLEAREIEMQKDQRIFRTNGMDTNLRTEAMLHAGIWF